MVQLYNVILHCIAVRENLRLSQMVTFKHRLLLCTYQTRLKHQREKYSYVNFNHNMSLSYGIIRLYLILNTFMTKEGLIKNNKFCHEQNPIFLWIAFQITETASFHNKESDTRMSANSNVIITIEMTKFLDSNAISSLVFLLKKKFIRFYLIVATDFIVKFNFVIFKEWTLVFKSIFFIMHTKWKMPKFLFF